MAVTGIDTERLEAWRTLLVTHAALVRRLTEELEQERGLHLAWYEVLLHLNEAPQGSLRMGDLARRALLTPSGLTRLVDRMETAGLVERKACGSDRRGSWATLTTAGRKKLKESSPVHVRGVEQYFARHLTKEEAKALTRSLNKMLADVRGDCQPL
jgi:DNA-binding MarR family transcriptional regulator